MAYKGRYTPKNPHKYKGNAANIIYRSLWERKVFDMLDHHPDVIQWASEETIVEYRSPLDNRIHRYFPDVWYRTKDGTERLIEIKPHKETVPPARPARQTSKYKKAVATYLVNQAKWQAARSYCKAHGMTFEILTEHDIGI